MDDTVFVSILQQHTSWRTYGSWCDPLDSGSARWRFNTVHISVPARVHIVQDLQFMVWPVRQRQCQVTLEHCSYFCACRGAHCAGPAVHGGTGSNGSSGGSSWWTTCGHHQQSVTRSHRPATVHKYARVVQLCLLLHWKRWEILLGPFQRFFFGGGGWGWGLTWLWTSHLPC